jgi:hypothetical protein
MLMAIHHTFFLQYEYIGHLYLFSFF